MKTGKKLIEKLKAWRSCPMSQEEIKLILDYVIELENTLKEKEEKQCLPNKN